jgi:hypothetical protein
MHRICWNLIKGPLTPSISPGLYSQTGSGAFQHGIKAEVLGSIPPGHAFSSVARHNSHLPCCSLSTHIARACGRDSHTGGGMLDNSIRGPHPLLYHLGYIVGLAGWPSNSINHYTLQMSLADCIISVLSIFMKPS